MKGRERNIKGYAAGLLIAALALASLWPLLAYAVVAPSGPDSMEHISNTSKEPTAGYETNVSGGKIYVMNMNATTQTNRWKAFVGNITGTFSLADSSNRSVYSWQIESVEGELYATRTPDTVDFTQVICANLTHIVAEETALNRTLSAYDNLTRTFNYTEHPSFYAGTKEIAANSCMSTYLYVAGEAQSSEFIELMLYDGQGIMYAALIENEEEGFDEDIYDYQLIVPDYDSLDESLHSAYYFYVELT